MVLGVHFYMEVFFFWMSPKIRYNGQAKNGRETEITCPI